MSKKPDLKIVKSSKPWQLKSREDLTPAELAAWDREIEENFQCEMRKQGKRVTVSKGYRYICSLDFLLVLFEVSRTKADLAVGEWLQRLFYFDREKHRRGYVTLSRQDLIKLYISPSAAKRALKTLEANKLIAVERRGRGRKPHIKPVKT